MMALTTLLLQPPEDLPSILIIDEPELGLHPHAIIQVGAMLASASTERQVIVATQSVQLLNQFAPADVVVVEQTNGVTRLRRLEEPGLREWLAEYSLGELWEKNVIGGRPG
jgi:predicted ATPase